MYTWKETDNPCRFAQGVFGMSTIYPVTGKGLWHDGIHKEGTAPVTLMFPGELIAYRKKGELIVPDRTPSLVQPEDVLLFSVELAERITPGLFGYLQTVGDLTEPLQRELFKKLGLCVSGDFVLFEHHISSSDGFSSREFRFYSMYMHLTDIPPEIAEKSGDSIAYAKKNTAAYTFPEDLLGNPGRAESMEHIFQIEYFTNIPFRADSYLTDGNRIATVQAGQQLYTLTGPEETVHVLPGGTYLETVENPDAVTRPASMKVRIKKIPGTIDIERAKEELLQSAVTEDEKKRAQNLNAADFFSGGTYILPQGLTSIPVTFNYDNTTVQTEITETETEKRNQNIQNIYIKKDAAGFGTVWVRTDNTVFKEMKAKNTVRVKTTSQIRTFPVPPDQYVAIGKEENTAEEKIVRKTDASIYYGKRDSAGNIYLPDKDGSAYYKAPSEFTGSCWDWQNVFTLCTAEDLKDYAHCTTGTELRNFFQQLYKTKGYAPVPCGEKETLQEFLERTKDIAEKCAFVHPSEWNRKKTISEYIFHYATQYRSIRDQIAVWDGSCKNRKLPKEIQNGNALCYFFPGAFESYVKKIYGGYAAELKLVQDMIMNLWILKQGNIGMYPESYSEDSAPDGATYCNQAVFLTIRAVDKSFTKFTGRSDNGFPEAPADYASSYSNRSSNHWCHVLHNQAADSQKTGIKEITGAQAQAYANLGYVVIVAWENEAEGGSPHVVTVRPSDVKYTDNDSILVAHVGGGKNEVRSLKGAFQRHSNDVKFYCNIQQIFIHNTNEIIKLSRFIRA